MLHGQAGVLYGRPDILFEVPHGRTDSLYGQADMLYVVLYRQPDMRYGQRDMQYSKWGLLYTVLHGQRIGYMVKRMCYMRCNMGKRICYMRHNMGNRVYCIGYRICHTDNKINYMACSKRDGHATWASRRAIWATRHPI